MALRTLLTSLLVAALTVPAAAAAQDEFEDDLLAPLTPGETRTAPRPKKKKPVPAPKSDLPIDELVSPLQEPTELVVSLAEPLQGARLFIDGQEVGVVNGRGIEVTPGEHRLQVKRLGFNDFQGIVSVPDGGRETVTVSLFPHSGVLAVQPNVPAAEVFVDGKRVGSSPIKDLLLKPGSYEIRVTKAGYSVELSRLNVRAGRDYNLTPQLSPVLAPDRPERPRPVASVNPDATVVPPSAQLTQNTTPWYGQWYVWAGAAVVAAAVGGGTYAAVSSQPSALTPEDVCGRTCDAVLNGVRASRRTVMFAPKLAF
ncbi:MAG: PEGA domain-containing protein [Myxococcota bacterium]|nr:PEGA domain-containing protein [Myxococcota bacterium]